MEDDDVYASATPPRSPHSAGGRKIDRPVFLPESFSGKGGEWAAWLEQFELAAEINAWTQRDCLHFLILLMKGHARDICSSLPPEKKVDYTVLKDALQQQFEPAMHGDWCHAAFLDRKRSPGEAAIDFGHELRRLVRKAYPEYSADTRDSLARDHFIARIGNGDVRVQLRCNKPKTLEDAINFAAELEQVRQLESKPSGQPNVNNLYDRTL